MGVTRILSRDGLYEGKVLWEEFHSWGAGSSARRLLAWAKQNGMLNPVKPQKGHMGPIWAMWRYALENPEEAFPAYKAHAEQYPTQLLEKGISEVTFDLFIKDIWEHIQPEGNGIARPGSDRYKEFYNKYKHIIEEE